MFKYLFVAYFADGTIIAQSQDDRSVNHVEGAEHNPSTFTDVLDKSKESALILFELLDQSGGGRFMVDLNSGIFVVNGTLVQLEAPGEELTERKIIYWRTGQLTSKGEKGYFAFNFGYEGKDIDGNVEKKIMTIG